MERAQHLVNVDIKTNRGTHFYVTCFLVNLAVTLAQMGQTVGLLDADVFGKSTDYYIGDRLYRDLLATLCPTLTTL